MKEGKVCVRSLKELFFITGNALAVCRGTWFTGSGAPELWQPIVEEDAEQIEMSHQTIWRSMVSPDRTTEAPTEAPQRGSAYVTG